MGWILESKTVTQKNKDTDRREKPLENWLCIFLLFQRKFDSSHCIILHNRGLHHVSTILKKVDDIYPNFWRISSDHLQSFWIRTRIPNESHTYVAVKCLAYRSFHIEIHSSFFIFILTYYTSLSLWIFQFIAQPRS